MRTRPRAGGPTSNTTAGNDGSRGRACEAPRGSHLSVEAPLGAGMDAPAERYHPDTSCGAPVGAGGEREISSILRWADADLALVLLKVGRRLALSSHETKSAVGARSRVAASN